ncbi:hypothetical protein EVA_13283 [gut metagenome]|uniref:Uncharacterized protein n=1 Tax=gut metagenome TaxID=749906 RepID=J9GGV0_9ZZZZ
MPTRSSTSWRRGRHRQPSSRPSRRARLTWTFPRPSTQTETPLTLEAPRPPVALLTAATTRAALLAAARTPVALLTAATTRAALLTEATPTLAGTITAAGWATNRQGRFGRAH